MQAPWSFLSGRVLTVERGFFRRRDGAAAADTQTTSTIKVCTVWIALSALAEMLLHPVLAD
jgi:hypothetical protein